ncbi:hypothetical protein [Cohnella luojiensis]|uniref:Uncharacterized protein n=1 Tax=Cohnella luojiensis TaxID=652876 RepID=A0A4Y8M8G5_9BACL|nr:hypothetical protein [Cohnella luojiensis]TFE30048.1 hypothetical protein E2980_04655 [Cohnella luojiensis]
MLLLLFLIIIPSAIGVYYLIKPSAELGAELEVKSIKQVVTHFKGFEDIQASGPIPAHKSVKYSVNE